MALEALTCPQCGSNNLEAKGGFFYCSHCGSILEQSDIAARRPVSISTNIEVNVNSNLNGVPGTSTEVIVDQTNVGRGVLLAIFVILAIPGVIMLVNDPGAWLVIGVFYTGIAAILYIIYRMIAGRD